MNNIKEVHSIFVGFENAHFPESGLPASALFTGDVQTQRRCGDCCRVGFKRRRSGVATKVNFQ